MKTWMQRMLDGGKSGPQSVSPKRAGPSSGRDNPLTIEDGSENGLRRQLVQVLLRDALRKHGIPPAWIECQILVISSRSKGPGISMRLVLKHWDERFLKFMPAFQAGLLADILRFEPRSAQWLQNLSWQLDVQATCPYTEMPHKDYWVETVPLSARVASRPAPLATLAECSSGEDHASPTAVPRQATAPDTEKSAMEDLEKLFAIRDHELNRQAADGHAPVGYEKTQPSAL